MKRFWGLSRPFPKRVLTGVRGGAPRNSPRVPCASPASLRKRAETGDKGGETGDEGVKLGRGVAVRKRKADSTEGVGGGDAHRKQDRGRRGAAETAGRTDRNADPVQIKQKGERLPGNTVK